MVKEYSFNITINLTDIGIEAESEAEARSKLSDQVSEYFADTTVEISEKEAKLISVDDI